MIHGLKLNKRLDVERGLFVVFLQENKNRMTILGQLFRFSMFFIVINILLTSMLEQFHIVLMDK